MPVIKALRDFLSASGLGLGVVLATALTAQAAPVRLDVTGTKTGAESVGPSVSNGAIGTSFTALADITVEKISFDLRCVSTCGGEVVLLEGAPGPTASPTSFIRRDSFDADKGGTFTLDLFGGIALEKTRTYSIVLSMTAGNAIWYQNVDPTLTEIGLTDGADFAAETLDSNASYRSMFRTLPQSGGAFDYTITGDAPALSPTPVPLPASGLLILSGLGFCLALKRRRT